MVEGLRHLLFCAIQHVDMIIDVFVSEGWVLVESQLEGKESDYLLVRKKIGAHQYRIHLYAPIFYNVYLLLTEDKDPTLYIQDFFLLMEGDYVLRALLEEDK